MREGDTVHNPQQWPSCWWQHPVLLPPPAKGTLSCGASCPRRDAPKAPKRGGWEAVVAQLSPGWAEEAAGCGWGNSEQQLFCHWRSPRCHQGGRRHLLSGRKLWARHLWHVGVRMGVKFSVRKPGMCSPGGSAARAGRTAGLWCKWVSVWVGVLILPVCLGCSPKRG